MSLRPYTVRVSPVGKSVAVVDAQDRVAAVPPAGLDYWRAKEWAIAEVDRLNREPAALPELGSGESRR
jgi:hypothetical protein